MTKILFFGPSHIAAVKSYLSTQQDCPITLQTVGVHGTAFYYDESYQIDDQGIVTLHNHAKEGVNIRWFHDLPSGGPKQATTFSLFDYDYIYLLNPLFVSNKRFRMLLITSGFICSEIGDADVRNLLLKHKWFAGGHQLISYPLWLSVFTHTFPGDMKILEAGKRLGLSDRMMLVPHVLPPKRLNSTEYGLYNLHEQNCLAAYIETTYGIRSLPLPASTYESTPAGGLYCHDRFHKPAPDRHHASPEYYGELFNEILAKYRP
ncbi:MAG: hypothetical protein ACK59A_11505 [Cyanobacteriota bacterium]|jgi:hypothetical protein